MFDRKPRGPKPFNKMPAQGRGCGLFLPAAPIGIKPKRPAAPRPMPRPAGPKPMPMGGPVPGHKRPAPMPMQGRGCFMM